MFYVMPAADDNITWTNLEIWMKKTLRFILCFLMLWYPWLCGDKMNCPVEYQWELESFEVMVIERTAWLLATDVAPGGWSHQTTYSAHWWLGLAHFLYRYLVSSHCSCSPLNHLPLCISKHHQNVLKYVLLYVKHIFYISSQTVQCMHTCMRSLNH